MKKIDYKLYTTPIFSSFLKDYLAHKSIELNILSEKTTKIDSLLEKEKPKLTGNTFSHVIKTLELDLKEVCELFFNTIPSTRLTTIKRSENKLEDLLGPYFNSKLEMVKASGIMETTLNELFKNKFDRIYAYEVYAIAISFGIEPHLLFDYFFGSAKAPIVGSAPLIEQEDNKATE